MKKPKVVFINFATKEYKRAQRMALLSAKIIGGADETVGYSLEDVDSKFLHDNREIFDVKRGAGLWLWKPYLICKALDQVDWNDYVFYCDSASIVINKISYLVESMNDDIWVSDLPLIEEQWTKAAVIDQIGMGDKKIAKSQQIQASFILVKKTQKAMEIMHKYLELCCDYELLKPLDIEDKEINCIEHREDQSILSVLLKKEHVTPHKDPTQFGKMPEFYVYGAKNIVDLDGEIEYQISEHDNDTYPVVIALHRSGNFGLKRVLSSIFYSIMSRKIILRVHPVKELI